MALLLAKCLYENKKGKLFSVTTPFVTEPLVFFLICFVVVVVVVVCNNALSYVHLRHKSVQSLQSISVYFCFTVPVLFFFTPLYCYYIVVKPSLFH